MQLVKDPATGCAAMHTDANVSSLSIYALQGIRTLVLTNATGQLLLREQREGQQHNEVWQHYPDFPGFAPTGKPGDPRAAVTPALAQAALGSDFNWLLYGDVSGQPVALACRQLPAAAVDMWHVPASAAFAVYRPVGLLFLPLSRGSRAFNLLPYALAAFSACTFAGLC